MADFFTDAFEKEKERVLLPFVMSLPEEGWFNQAHSLMR